MLVFEPIYKERVWGGQRFADALKRPTDRTKHIGESWEIVDRPEAQSVIVDGEYKGMTIRELLEKHGKEVMGPKYEGQPFPILVKWLDSDDRLSLQVHPPADIAPELNGEPKTENWYIVEADENAAVLAGLKEGTTREMLEQSLKDNNMQDYVCRLPVKPGDSLFVESGRLHAIDAGNLILEIQQNSDTTYRTYDWGRVDLDGKPRELHIEESLKCIDYNDFEPELLKTGNKPAQLVTSPIFNLRKIVLKKGETVTFAKESGPKIISVTKGKVAEELSTRFYHFGTNALLPYNKGLTLNAYEDTELLVTEDFVG
jgi:mannose-6-phosphate isomerase